jgi:phage gpG-like protein
MTTEQYSIGYEAGYQDGWNEAQKPFVGLTDEEIQDLMDVVDHYNFPEDLITYTQAKLKEKNT